MRLCVRLEDAWDVTQSINLKPLRAENQAP